ncbi:MAG: 2OG-Fe(II) oxygenase [Acidobacteria bacterium]|nr:2OG-Fe(II) oxygenase [Acidobacteriota bacterium]
MRYVEEARGLLSTQLLKPSASRDIVTQLKRLRGWQTAQVLASGAGEEFRAEVDDDYRSAGILTSPRAEQIYRRFDRIVARRVKPLIREFWGVEPAEYEGYQIVRYRRGGHYHEHSDSGDQLAERYFTLVCYLNDDFRGGGTWFPSLGHLVTPRSGKAVIFPSKYLHSAEPVESGEKYVLVTWVLGPIPIRWF